MGLSLLSYPKPSKWLCGAHSLLRTAVCHQLGGRPELRVFIHPRGLRALTILRTCTASSVQRVRMMLVKGQPGLAGGLVDEGSQGPLNMSRGRKSFEALCPGKSLVTRAGGS